MLAAKEHVFYGRRGVQMNTLLLLLLLWQAWDEDRCVVLKDEDDDLYTYEDEDDDEDSHVK